MFPGFPRAALEIAERLTPDSALRAFCLGFRAFRMTGAASLVRAPSALLHAILLKNLLFGIS